MSSPTKNARPVWDISTSGLSGRNRSLTFRPLTKTWKERVKPLCPKGRPLSRYPRGVSDEGRRPWH